MHGPNISPQHADAPVWRRPGLRTISALRIGQPLAYLGAAAVVSLAVLVRVVMQPALPTGLPFLTLYPGIIITAYLFGARAAVAGAVLSLIVSWWLFIGPEVDFALGVRAPVAMATFFFVALMVAAMMHTMQLANLRLATERDNNARLVENREVLFRELQHRVGNSLQLVASVLALQRRKLAEPEAIDAIDEASRRVALIGKVQRQLFDPSGAPLALAPFLNDICCDLVEAAGKPGLDLHVEGGEDVLLPPDLAIPTALVLSEAVLNAIEHGFAGREEGAIGIKVQVEGGALAIMVEDDGAGLPQDFDFDRSQSLGLRISHKLASYHGGTFTLRRGEGVTIARIELPLTR